jgi:hypothetical protein
MEKLRFMLSFLALVLTVSFTAVSCGTNSPSQLQSMTVSPAAADAQSFPNGIGPFVATGVYVNPPRTVTPQQRIGLDVKTLYLRLTFPLPLEELPIVRAARQAPSRSPHGTRTVAYPPPATLQPPVAPDATLSAPRNSPVRRQAAIESFTVAVIGCGTPWRFALCEHRP